MSKRTAVSGGLAVGAFAVALAACGGTAKPADAPGTCPEGTVLDGSQCVAQSTSGDGESAAAPAKESSGGGDSARSTPASDGPLYDKDAVDDQLKRAAKQVKDNCGSATDDDGNKTGPWGATSATIVLGRNGHVADVSVPAPYAGKPVGECVVRSFQKIQFPPYAAPSDVSVQWDVVIAAPKHK